MKKNTAKLSRDHVKQALEAYLVTYFGKSVEVQKYHFNNEGEISVEVITK